MTGRFDYLESQLHIGWQTDAIGAGLVSPSDRTPSLMPLFASINTNIAKSLPELPFCTTQCLSGLSNENSLSYQDATARLVVIDRVDHAVDEKNDRSNGHGGEQLVGSDKPASIVSAFARQRLSGLSQLRKVQLSRLLH